MTKKRVSIKQIAQAANVSSALVSMVLNGKAKQYGISEEAACRVLKIAKELDYQPNYLARGLRSGRSQLIGLVVTDISNPFFSSLARAIEKAAARQGYTVIYGSSEENPALMHNLIHTLVNQGVDGIIAIPAEEGPQMLGSLADDNFPLVLVDRNYPNLVVSSVVLNNEESSASLTRHFIEEGFCRITCVAYESEMSHMLERVSGYVSAMSEAGLSLDVRKVEKDNAVAQLRVLLTEILREDKTSDALVFCSNTLTLDGLEVIQQLGLSIPRDVAVAGYDGGRVFDLFTPPITYVAQPLDEMGKEAVDLLISQIETEDPEACRRVLVKSSLVLTESSSGRFLSKA